MQTSQSDPVPTPATDEILKEITALYRPIQAGPLDPEELAAIKRHFKGIGIIILVLVLLSGVSWIKAKVTTEKYTPRQERGIW